MTREQLARDIIEMGLALLVQQDGDQVDPQRLTAGDLVEISNKIREYILECKSQWTARAGADHHPGRDPLNQELDDLRGENATLRNLLDTAQQGNRPQRLTAGDLVEIAIAGELCELKAKIADVVSVVRGEIDPVDLDTLAHRRRMTRERRKTDPGYCPHGSRLASCHDCAMEAEFFTIDIGQFGPTGNPGPMDEDIARGPRFPSLCPHGVTSGLCHACDQAADLASEAIE